MTLNDLKQYRFICRRIAQLEATLSDNTVVDSVQGSQKDYPFIKHSVKIRGVSPELDNDASELRGLCYKKTEIERFISCISDSQTREIFRLRFLKGLSWVQVAFKIGSGNTEDCCRKRVFRYLKNHSNL